MNKFEAAENASPFQILTLASILAELTKASRNTYSNGALCLRK